MGNSALRDFCTAGHGRTGFGARPKIENDPRFPKRTNVEFIEVISRNEVRQAHLGNVAREKLGLVVTGASAVCVAGVLTGRTERSILNHLLGGDLRLEWNEQTGHVMMTGGAVEIFSGEWP